MFNSIIPQEIAIPEFKPSRPAELPRESTREHRNMQRRVAPPQQWFPFSEGGRISEKVKGEVADEARRLYDTWQKRIAYRAQIVSDSTDAEQKARRFPAEMEDAIVSEIDNEGDFSTLATKAQEYKAVIDAADPNIWTKAVKAAGQAVTNAKAELESFLDSNFEELVEDHRAEAERVAKEWSKAHDQVRKRLAPLEAEHDELVQSLSCVIGRTHPFTSRSIPHGEFNPDNGYGKAPLPSAAEMKAAV